jgi:outer membrane lipoprotein-sorting protein
MPHGPSSDIQHRRLVLKSTFARVLSLSILIIWAATAVAQSSAKVPQFSADMVITGAKGLDSSGATGKLYYGGTRIRMDMASAGHQSTVITDLPSKTSYVVMPAQHMYMEQKASNTLGRRSGPEWKAYDPENPCANQEGTTCKKVGSESVNGRMCDKWLITDKNNKTSTVWIDQKNHIPIKTLTADGATMEFKNIQEGTQNSSLFEIPSGYTKLDMGGMMKGLQGMQGLPQR